MTPVVLVHGFMGGSAQWAAQVAALGHTHEVVALDLPGFGANRHMPALRSIPVFAQWVIVELKRRGIERYHLMGHSMGGMIAQEITRLDQENIDRLILYGTGAVGVLPGRFETIEHSKARVAADGPQVTARRISATWFLDREDAPSYADCATLAEQSSSEAIFAGLDAMQAWRGDAFLSQITRETLLIWGDRDRTYQWPQTQQLWEEIPNAHLAVIPQCAHAVHLENPKLFNLIVDQFLNG